MQRSGKRRLGRGVVVEEVAGVLTMRTSWLSFMAFAAGLFGGAFIAMGLSRPMPEAGVTGRWIAEMSIAILCGGGLSYVALCYAFNRTVLRCEGDSLHRVSGPFPPRRPLTLPIRDVAAFELTSTDGVILSGRNRLATIRLDLVAVDKRGVKHELLGDLPTYAIASELCEMLRVRYRRPSAEAPADGLA